MKSSMIRNIKGKLWTANEKKRLAAQDVMATYGLSAEIVKGKNMSTVTVGTSTAPCIGCTSPDGQTAPSGEYGAWVAGGVNSINGTQRWSWLRQMPVPYPADVQSTTFLPQHVAPVPLNQPNLAPGATQPLSVSGGSSSTSNPATDGQRRVVGQIANGPAFANPA